MSLQTRLAAVLPVIKSFVIARSRPPLAAASVPVQNVNVNATLGLVSERTDAGWSLAANVFAFSGTPDRVRVSVMVLNVGGVSRANPALILQKNDGAGWIDVAHSASGYIRNTTGHTESSNTISFVDWLPGVDPQYRVQAEQESSASGAVNSEVGHVVLEAVL